jgi:hypothetical protein
MCVTVFAFMFGWYQPHRCQRSRVVEFNGRHTVEGFETQAIPCRPRSTQSGDDLLADKCAPR